MTTDHATNYGTRRGVRPAIADITSDDYVRTTNTLAGGGRSLYDEHMALYKAELEAERAMHDLEFRTLAGEYDEDVARDWPIGRGPDTNRI